MFQKNRHSSEFGGIFIYIFIGIALFALLAFTFSRSQQGVSSSVLSDGRVKTSASQIITYSATLERAVQSLISKGCSENQLNFENEFVDDYDNPAAPSDGSCDVFSPGKGGVTWKKPPSGSNGGEDWFIANHVSVAFAGTYNAAGGQCNNGAINCLELVLLLPNISQDLCLAINTINEMVPRAGVGLLVEENNGPTVYNNSNKFTGTFTTYADDIDAHTFFDGDNKSLTYGCTQNSNTGQYDYWKVLLAR